MSGTIGKHRHISGPTLSQARRFIDSDFNYVFWPCLAITLVVFAFNMLGDALRDLLDPRLRADV